MSRRLVVVIVVFICAVFGVSLASASILSVSKNKFRNTTDNLTAQIASLKVSLGVATQSIRESISSTNKTAVSALSVANGATDNLVSLTTKLANLNNQINDLTSQVNDYNNRMTNIESNVGVLSSKVDSKVGVAEIQALQAQITTTNSQLASLQTQLNTLANTVKSLQANYSGNAKLLGNDDANIVGEVGGGTFALNRFQCSQSGMLAFIHIKVAGSGNVMVALYSDGGALMSANNSGIAVVAGWSSIPITAVQVYSGVYYWLAYISDSSIIGYEDTVNGHCIYETSVPYGGFTFPASITSGFNNGTANTLIAGWIN